MPTQVDWNWQVQNRPSVFPGSIVADNDPSTGPYTLTELLFQNSSGIYITSLGEVYVLPESGSMTFNNSTMGGPYTQPVWTIDNYSGLYASSDWTLHQIPVALNQPGGVGFGGSTNVNGSYWFCRLGETQTPIPSWGDGNLIVLQGGNLAWQSDDDPASGGPLAGFYYVGSPLYGTMEFFTPADLFIYGAEQTDSVVEIQNVWNSKELILSSSGTRSTLQDVDGWNIIAGPDFGANLIPQIYPLNSLLNIDDGIGQAAFACHYNVGLWVTDPTGNVFTGGILTSAGTGSLGGDVTGTLGSSELTSIQGNPVLASSPTMGDVLEWNGTDWIPSPGGSSGIAIGDPVSGGTPGDTLQVDGSGNLGQWIPWEILQGGGSVAVDSSGDVTIQTPAGTTLYADAGGDITLGQSWSTLSMPYGGDLVLSGGGGGALTLDSSGNGTLLSKSTAGCVVGNLSVVSYLDIDPTYGPLIKAFGTEVFTAPSASAGTVGVSPSSGLAWDIYGDTSLQGQGGAVTIDHSGNVQADPAFGAGLGFYGQAPISQQSAYGITSGFTAGIGTPVLVSSTFTGAIGSTAYTLGDLVAVLKYLGLITM